MKTKLTLSIDKETIEKGRQLAQNKQQSLSFLIEEILNKEIEKDRQKRLALIGELQGIAGKVSSETDWKQVIRESAFEKHGK
jgi:predicted transcriptional regulator